MIAIIVPHAIEFILDNKKPQHPAMLRLFSVMLTPAYGRMDG
ncbi:hypothetical protein BN855_4060 [Salmonella enterica subsp. enterica serovar Bovismorbificans str. 3114]|nr:hypothetical protein BN855_4060 [Salmonella enterica subsp. enterica serovar Bovismorbificans str. 3114]